MEPGAQAKTVPLREAPLGVTAVAMVGSSDTLVLGTSEGRLLLLDCASHTVLQEGCHEAGIRAVLPHPSGTR